MQRTKTPVSRLKVAVTWLLFLGFIIGWIAFLLWRHRNNPVPSETGSGFAHAVVSLFIGGFFFAIGAGS